MKTTTATMTIRRHCHV